MSQTRIYGSAFAGLGASAAAWTTLVSDGGFTPTCVNAVSDIQEGTDGCGVGRLCNNSAHTQAYGIPDAAIPDNATASLVTYGLRYVTAEDFGAGALVRGYSDIGNTAGYTDTFGAFETDATKTLGLSQSGATTKSQAWGFQSQPFNPALDYQIFVSEFAIKLTFTLPSPTAVTTAATNVNGPSATLNGTVNPNTATTQYPMSYKFEWGTTTAYGNSTTTVGGQTGSSNIAASAAISGLTAGITYHFRVVAFNADVTVNGSDQTFVSGTFDNTVMAF